MNSSYSYMANKTQTPQQRLEMVSNKKNHNLNKIPKTFHQLLSFMDSNIRKQFRSFSLLAICGGAEKSRFAIQENYIKAFERLTLKQKLDLYEKAVDYGVIIFNEQNTSDIQTRQQFQQQLNNELSNLFPNNQPSLQFFITIHQGFRSNQQIKIKLQKFKISTKKNFNINVQNYILRKSKKKNPQCYIFQAINNTDPECIRFSFANQEQQKQYLPVIQKTVDLAYKNNIISMLIPQTRFNSNYNNYSNSPTKMKKLQQQKAKSTQQPVLNNSSFAPNINNRQSIGRLKIPELKSYQDFGNQKGGRQDERGNQETKDIIRQEDLNYGVLEYSCALAESQKQILNNMTSNQRISNMSPRKQQQQKKIQNKNHKKVAAQDLINSTKSIQFGSKAGSKQSIQYQLQNNKNKRQINEQQQDYNDENLYTRVLESQSDIKQPLLTHYDDPATPNIKSKNNNKLSLISKPTPSKKNIPSQQSIRSPINRFTESQVQEVKLKQKPFLEKEQEMHKNVFQIMLPDFNLREFQHSISSKNFKEIYMLSMSNNNFSNDPFTILQHVQKKQRFKCIFFVNLSSQKSGSVPITLQTVYSLLINQQLNKKWNHLLDQSQIKITLTAQNCLICYQKHKRYNSWFKQRDYLFIRHAFVYKNCKYIVDRSIEHNSFIPFQSIQRGQIKHNVIRLRETRQGQVEVIVDLWMDHCGYLGAEKKKQLNLAYLKQYEGFCKFVQDNFRAISSLSPTLKTKYCDQNWNIDWIDKQQGSSYPRALSLKTQQFNEGSQIDFYQQGDFCQDNVDLQSQDFYSIKDQYDQQNENNENQLELKLNSKNNSKENISHEGDKNKNMFVKNKQNQKQQKLEKQSQEFLQEQEELQQRPELQQQQHDAVQKSMYQQPALNTSPNNQIILNDQGLCILPQKYIKKYHPLKPITPHHNQQQRVRVYQNIVLKSDFVLDKQEGILLVNKQKIAAQDNVISFIMKTMRKNLLTGKSVLNISLPVEIFKQDSNTQRIAESMGLGPLFLQNAVKQSSPLQRFKWSICFAFSNSLLYFYMDKQFNPILGQTYQGMIDGCPIYAEQISHHPPITSIYFVGRGYKVYASLEAKVYLHLNSGDGINMGFYTIEFDDGGIVKFQTSPGEISGITIGDRKFKFKDRLYVLDPINNLYIQALFDDPSSGFFSKGKWKYPDQMQGQILQVTPSFIKKILATNQQKDKPHPKQKQIVQSLSKLQGRWISYVKFDNKMYYNIENDIPYQLKNYQNPLNSDARYRQDLIYRAKNDIGKSQIYKQLLQNKQRKDRKLRQQYGPKNKH